MDAMVFADATMAGGLDATAMDAMAMAPLVPVPPMTGAFDWPDIEPNDTAAQAVPVGILEGAMWMGFGATPSRIATNTDTDFYVFRTGNAASLVGQQPMSVCGSQGVDLVDLYLYAVVNGRLGALLKSAATTTPSCETILSTAEIPMVLMPESIYVLEVRAAAGLMLGANTGGYNA